MLVIYSAMKLSVALNKILLIDMLMYLSLNNQIFVISMFRLLMILLVIEMGIYVFAY